MSVIPSKHLTVLDGSSTSFRTVSQDLGDAVAILSGGLMPCGEELYRIRLSLRAAQAFLMEEADEQQAREAIAQCVRPIHIIPIGGADAHS